MHNMPQTAEAILELRTRLCAAIKSALPPGSAFVCLAGTRDTKGCIVVNNCGMTGPEIGEFLDGYVQATKAGAAILVRANNARTDAQ